MGGLWRRRGKMRAEIWRNGRIVESGLAKAAVSRAKDAAWRMEVRADRLFGTRLVSEVERRFAGERFGRRGRW